MAALVLALFAVGLLSCKDDLADPTLADVKMRFRSDPPSLVQGAEVWLDGQQIVASLASAEVVATLEEGLHTIVIRKDCVRVEPADTMTIEVAGGRPRTVDFMLRQSGALLSVISDPPGLAIAIDDSPTGVVTPASFPCVDSGSHEVRVDPPSGIGFDIVGETVRTVEVPSEGSVEAAFVFASTPRPQSRGVMMELFTATLCPNCPIADHAAVEIQEDPTYAPGTMTALEIHLSWGGTDPFNTEQINTRRVNYYYGNETQSAPVAYFNGRDRVVGSNLPDIKATYMGKIALSYGSDAQVGLYWTGARVEGSLVRGDLRMVAIEEISGFDRPELVAYYAKDSLTAPFDPFQVGQFMGVVRAYSEPIDLKEAGLTTAGSFLDREFVFDLTLDTAPPDRPLRLGAFVQDRSTKEVLQLREVHIPRP